MQRALDPSEDVEGEPGERDAPQLLPILHARTQVVRECLLVEHRNLVGEDEVDLRGYLRLRRYLARGHVLRADCEGELPDHVAQLVHAGGNRDRRTRQLNPVHFSDVHRLLLHQLAVHVPHRSSQVLVRARQSGGSE